MNICAYLPNGQILILIGSLADNDGGCLNDWDDGDLDDLLEAVEKLQVTIKQVKEYVESAE